MILARCPHCGQRIEVVLSPVREEPAPARQVTSRPPPAFAVGDRVRVTQHVKGAVEGQVGTVQRVYGQSVHVAIPDAPSPLSDGCWSVYTWQVEKEDPDA